MIVWIALINKLPFHLVGAHLLKSLKRACTKMGQKKAQAPLNYFQNLTLEKTTKAVEVPFNLEGPVSKIFETWASGLQTSHFRETQHRPI
jgi:hypothetical protein